MKNTQFVKVAIIDKDGNINPWCCTINDDESNYLTFKYWEKGDYKRIYVNDYKRRTVGYINLITKEIVSDYSNNSDYVRTMKYFIENQMNYFLKMFEINIDNK